MQELIEVVIEAVFNAMNDIAILDLSLGYFIEIYKFMPI